MERYVPVEFVCTNYRLRSSRYTVARIVCVVEDVTSASRDAEREAVEPFFVWH